VEERQRLGLVGAGTCARLRGVVERVLGGSTPPARSASSRPTPASPAAPRPHRVGGPSSGYLGKIDRGGADKLSLRDVPAAAELDIEPLLQGAQLVPQLQPLPTYPRRPARDLSLDVAEAVRYEQIEALVRDVARNTWRPSGNVST
jgi:hypothetical protein